MSFEESFSLASLSETQRLGEKIASLIQPQDLILLKGDLGTGKTALARFIITALNPAISHVPSPTFTLVQTYETPRGTLWHLDLYRLNHREEVYELGLEEALGSTITLIEWPERMEGFLLPSSVLEITLTLAKASEKRVASLKLSESWRQRWRA